METTYPPKDKVHALILAMSEELQLLRAVIDGTGLLVSDEVKQAKVATQAAAIAVGCRPDGPLNS